MEHAGITVHIKNTYRPIQTSYLLYYSWEVKKGKISSTNVPAFKPVGDQEPVDICWLHTSAGGTPQIAASVKAAANLYNALRPDPKLKMPAFPSLHNVGKAVDMTTTWKQKTITIVNGQGKLVDMNTLPHSGLNLQLMAVGLTFTVHHFCYPAGTCKTMTPADDRNHWSTTGH